MNNDKLNIRAWDDELKCFIYFNESKNISFWKSVLKYNMPISVCSGILDINKENIWEGDICMIKGTITEYDNIEWMGICEFNNGCFNFRVIAGDGKICSFINDSKRIRLIGNKFENNELLLKKMAKNEQEEKRI